MFKKSLLLLAVLLIVSFSVFAETITVSWTASSSSDVKYYRIYQTSTPGIYTQSNRIARVAKSTRSYKISNVSTASDVYWIITAEDNSGNESVLSDEISNKWYNAWFRLSGTAMPAYIQYR